MPSNLFDVLMGTALLLLAIGGLIMVVFTCWLLAIEVRDRRQSQVPKTAPPDDLARLREQRKGRR